MAGATSDEPPGRASRGRRPSRLVLLGAPVAHSLSPAMQGAALAAAGIPLRYEAVHVEPVELGQVLRALVAEGAAGNVTVPHKEAVAASCDRLTSVAARVGAVNTFWTEEGLLVGDNTDVGGFDVLARETLGRAPVGLRVAILGAGGAAAAVLEAAGRWPGCAVTVHARNPDRTRRLVERLASQEGRGPGCTVRMAPAVGEAVRDADLVVNATPLGLYPDDPFPVAIGALPPGAVVVDLVYRKGGTRWVRDARAAGHRAADGLGMLVEQGALAFSCWLGMEPDRAVMWRALAS